jgi:membrane associated rhomboid family serine protease
LNISPTPHNDESTTPEHDWDLAGWVPDKSRVCDYGYVVKGQAIGCSREELVKAFPYRAAEIKLVWTPETPEPVFPEKVPLLLDAFRKLAVKEARNALFWGLAILTGGLVMALAIGEWKLLYRNFLVAIGAVFLIEGAWQLARTRHYTLEDAEADASTLRFTTWINNKHVSGYTFLLAACIVIVGVFQGAVGAEQSINIAGLVKPAVWQGQVWRLFTACLMHVSITHFWMNLLALLHFARIVEQTILRAAVPLVFLVSGVCGSLFSLMLYPHTTSVGASGGLMGLLGFITMAAYFARTRYPRKYLRNSIEAIIFVGVWGLVGFAFIDNAAHLGGLCGGLSLGWALLMPFDKHYTKQKFERRLSAIAKVVLFFLGLVCATAVWKMIQ